MHAALDGLVEIAVVGLYCHDFLHVGPKGGGDLPGHGPGVAGLGIIEHKHLGCLFFLSAGNCGKHRGHGRQCLSNGFHIFLINSRDYLEASFSLNFLTSIMKRSCVPWPTMPLSSYTATLKVIFRRSTSMTSDSHHTLRPTGTALS